MTTTVQMTIKFHTVAEAARVRRAAEKSGVMPTRYYRATLLAAVGETKLAADLLANASERGEEDGRFSSDTQSSAINFRQPVDERALITAGIERTGLQQKDWARLVFLTSAGDVKSADEIRRRHIELGAQLRRVRMSRARR